MGHEQQESFDFGKEREQRYQTYTPTYNAMKLALLSSVLALAASVFAADDVEESNPEAAEIVTDPNFVPTPERPFNFLIDYEISFKEDKTSGAIDDFYNGETVELFYHFKSLEPSEVSIVGVGGELLDPVTGLSLANITASQLGPISVENNKMVNFTQRVGINMAPRKYLLVPAVYVIYEDQFMLLGSKNKLINIVDPKISIFNPQLLFAELVLGATVAGVLYLLYNAFAAKYLAGILPESLLPVEKKKKKSAKPSTSDSKGKSTSSKADYESWLPDSHKNLAKKSKKKL